LQTLVEGQMETFLGVRFLASEYATGKTHRGRIDSLGLDENGCPVIVEYKRHSNENVINQGLFYLDWLLDHKAEFRWLVMEKLGREVADAVEWSGTRLLCIAADFTRYDQHAVQQIPRNIELIRYKQFGDDLLLLELVNTQSVADGGGRAEQNPPAEEPLPEPAHGARRPIGKDRSLAEQLETAPEPTRQLYADLRSFVFSLGDDVNEKLLKLYTAFRKLRNFTTVVVQPNRLLVYLKLDPATVALEDGFSRDVSQTGHWGTGDVELCLRTAADLERAKPLIERAYAEG
jgi:predicted transport protein